MDNLTLGYTTWEFWPDCHRMKPLGYCYIIFNKQTGIVISESTEYFESKARAELAAIGHISLLENGEG